MRIGGMCELLRRILKAAEGDEERVAGLLESWRDYFNEAIDHWGLPVPFDFEQVDAILVDYQAAFAPFRAWLEDRSREDVRREARRDCLALLLKLTSLAQKRRAPYGYVNEICVGLTRLVELSDELPTPENRAAIGKVLEEHDRALLSFRTFAMGR